jgi:hypothetical protein
MLTAKFRGSTGTGRGFIHTRTKVKVAKIAGTSISIFSLLLVMLMSTTKKVKEIKCTGN